MSFPSDIKMAMRDCILKIFWPKKDILSFFSNCGCSKQDMKVIGNLADAHRYEIIDNMFDHLSNKSDQGLGVFRSMLQALTNWSQFDPYYFDKLRKLNKADAEGSISHLKQLQEIRDHKIKADRKAREERAEANQKPTQTLNALKERYLALMSGVESLQRRGYELEQILLELAKLSKCETTEPFRVRGEQIDGAIKFDGEHYIVEAKWQEQSASNEPIYQFVGKVEGKLYGRGIFVSINGFSTNVLSSLVHGKAIKTIFVDGQDLMMVLEGYQTFSDMLDKKVKSAQTKGDIYVNAIDGRSKIS
ncbi:TPA: restriction endonuclease [Vibrio diabolicus]|uniref:restriction endonuclease n=1 Tax=Vibrio diabolicus TaxID=50719 RepID=UPI00216059B4|nr:restriction endonuclease [Vibrio diabolicus]MCS0343000.1 restriction endonuclease [Vibrio diabolicus]